MKKGASYLFMLCEIFMCVVSSTPLVTVHSMLCDVGGPRQDSNVVAPTMDCLFRQYSNAGFDNWRLSRKR